MPKTYAADVRLRAVALAEATSLEDAARKLSIPKDTIARWVDEAPDQSALERAHDLAMSELTAKIAGGETRGTRDLAVVAGIMRDKIARYGRKDETPEPDWHDRLNAWVDATYPPDVRPLAQRAITRQLGDELHEIQAQPDYLPPEHPFDAPDRDEETDAALFGGFRSFLEGIPDLEAWHAEWEVREAERHRLQSERIQAEAEHYHAIGLRVRYLVENTDLPVKECIARAQQPVELDPDTLALLERAEAYLQENP